MRAAAVILTGSGPLDRNANMKRQPLNVSLHLAEALGEAGVASLRFDKRGVGASDGDYKAAGFHDNVADAGAAVEFLRSETGAAPVFVIGHSEGALIATRLAASSAAIDGVVLLAGPARSGRATMEFQLEILAQIVPRPALLVLRLFGTSPAKVQLKRIERIQKSTGDTMRVWHQKVNAKWMREFLAYDPTLDLAAIDRPLLAITGKKDIQVPVEDLAVIAGLAGGPVETHALDDLSHVLRRDSGPPTLKTYRAQMNEPTDPEVCELVSDWILRWSAR